MVPVWVWNAERRITYVLWKLAWLGVFIIAKKSLICWTNELK